MEHCVTPSHGLAKSPSDFMTQRRSIPFPAETPDPVGLPRCTADKGLPGQLRAEVVGEFGPVSDQLICVSLDVEARNTAFRGRPGSSRITRAEDPHTNGHQMS